MWGAQLCSTWVLALSELSPGGRPLCASLLPPLPCPPPCRAEQGEQMCGAVRLAACLCGPAAWSREACPVLGEVMARLRKTFPREGDQGR